MLHGEGIGASRRRLALMLCAVSAVLTLTPDSVGFVLKLVAAVSLFLVAIPWIRRSTLTDPKAGVPRRRSRS